MSPAYALPPAAAPDYARHGAVVLRGVLTPDEVATLARGIEHNLAHLSPLAMVASQADDPGKFVEDFCTWQHNADYAAVMQHSALPRAAAALMQSETVRIYHDHLLVKEPGTKQATPWHQDQPCYNVAGRQNVSFWIPVDLVPLASTWYMPRTFRDQQAKWFLGDDARHAVRSWRTSPPFAGLADRLADGAVMDDAVFPLVATE